MSSMPPDWPPLGQPNPFGDSYQPPPSPYQPSAPRGAPLGDDKALRWVLPVGTSIWAILAGYSGLISLGCWPIGPLAVVFGIVALYDIKQNANIGGMGRAIFGIVSGLLGSLVLLIAIIAYIASGGQ